MFLHIDTNDGLPIYLQIVNQVKHAVASGALTAGDQLPSVRDLAVQIRINPNTVVKAYQELQRQGVVEFRRGNGTFVSETPPDLNKRQKRELVARHLDRALVEALHLGISTDEVVALLQQQALALARRRKEAADDE